MGKMPRGISTHCLLLYLNKTTKVNVLKVEFTVLTAIWENITTVTLPEECLMRRNLIKTCTEFEILAWGF